MSTIEIVHINGKLLSTERETLLNYDGENRTWIMDTTVLKHFNKAIKQGWKQTVEYRYDDETVCGGVFEAPERSITIRSTEKKLMSEKQLTNLCGDEDEE